MVDNLSIMNESPFLPIVGPVLLFRSLPHPSANGHESTGIMTEFLMSTIVKMINYWFIKTCLIDISFVSYDMINT